MVDGERDLGAEGVAGDGERQRSGFGRAVVERGAQIVAFAGAAIVTASAGADTAKVEAHRGDAHRRRAAENRAHDVVVHIAAELRVRVSDDDGETGPNRGVHLCPAA